MTRTGQYKQVVAINFYERFISINDFYRTVPKKGYKSLTIKDAVYERFMKEVKEVKKSNSKVENSDFLDSLLDKHKKSK